MRDPAVLDAIRAVPRREFVDPELADRAEADEPLPIGDGQTISQPLVVAMMASALEIGRGDRVLEVGGGSGYAAAVLGQLAAEVHAVEIRETLARRASEAIARVGAGNVHVHLGDGRAGWAEAAPFDAISVAAGAAAVPPALVAQLAARGRLVMPVGPSAEAQRLIRMRRQASGEVMTEDLGAPVRFVPLIGGHGE